MRQLKAIPIFKGLALLFSLLMLQPEEAQATHFRYGNITWERVAGQPYQIRFRVTQAWRRSFPGWGSPNVGATVNTGTMNTGSGSQNILLTVTSVNIAEDWFYGEYTFIKTYPSVSANYTASFDICCRVSNLSNNNDLQARVISLVSVGNNNDAPVSTVPPFISLPTNTSAATYQIPATDPNGDSLSFSLVPNGQFGTSNVQPSGISISSTGLVTFNTVGKAVGTLWNTAIYVTDSKGARIQLDLMIRVTTPSTPPTFDYSVTPANGINYVLQPGQTLSFGVKASDVDVADIVGLSAVGVPVGGSFTPTSGNPVTQTFSWTPTIANVGTYQVNFVAQDNASIQTNTIVNIAVSLKPNFVAPSLGNGSVLCYVPGDTITQTYTANDVDTSDRVRLSLVSSSQTGMNFSPSLPTAALNPATTNFTWNTSTANWGINTVVIRATDNYTETKDDTVYYIVNNPPVITTTQGNAVITAGQAFSYTLAATDVNVAQGDVVSLSHTTHPSWLSIVDNNNGSWTISGTPTLADSGTHVISLAVEDKTNHFRGTHCGSAAQTFEITVLPCNITTSTAATNVLCNGGNTGSIDLTVNNATAPVSYLWSNNATTEDLSNVAAGNYSVTIIDANGCTATDSDIVTEPTLLVAAATGTNNTCNGGNTGTADLTVSGGTAPYTYLWSNNATTEDISGLAAGTYTVVVTDNNGCTANAGYTVTQPTAVSATIPNTAPTVAGHAVNTIYLGYGAQSVTLTVNAAGGTPGYTYSWSNGAATASTTVSPTSTTTYTVVVTDANGCTYTASKTIKVVDARCGNNKVTICHIPSGNNNNPQSICVSVNAVPAHLSHDCYVGPCGTGAKGRGNAEEEQILSRLNETTAKEFSVYPNPNNGSFVLELPTTEAAVISVSNVSGQVVYTKEVNNTNKVTIDMGGIAKGIYILQVTSDHDSYKSKLTIQ